MESIIAPEFAVELTQFLEAINRKYNYDFRQYAPNSLRRTLVQAMNQMGVYTLQILQEKILDDATSFDELLQSLTIAVSELFRDPSYFLSLRQQVVPYLRTYPSIKIWVAGCSTGEEAYSLAILLQEEDLLARTTLYATDINARSLETAATGVFRREDFEKAMPRYQISGGNRSLADYCTATGTSVQFHPSFRQQITFVDHSLVTDAVFSETHLISCRNVLIYFNRELQDRAIGLFHESLCGKGFLGLGAMETIQFSRHASDFDPFVREDRIFQKKHSRSALYYG